METLGLYYTIYKCNDKTKIIEFADEPLKSYLKDNLRIIRSRKYFVLSSKKWYELWNQRNLNNFLNEKIVTPELSERNNFTIVSSKVFYGDTVCGISIKNEFKNNIDLKFLLGILNSKLID